MNAKLSRDASERVSYSCHEANSKELQGEQSQIVFHPARGSMT